MVKSGQILYEVYPMLDAPLKDLVERLKSYSKSWGNAWIIKSAHEQKNYKKKIHKRQQH